MESYLQFLYFLKKAVNIHPSTLFNTAPVAHKPCQKYLDLYFDEKLSFNNNINIKMYYNLLLRVYV